jgi:hypothetical protein
VSYDERWYRIPDDALPGQYRIGDFIEMQDGSVMRIVSKSTSMLRIRPIRWWERLFASVVMRKG